jgi:hypothetical protein
MKANHSILCRAKSIICLFAITIITLCSCHKNYQDGDLHTGVYTINGNASGSQMVPAVTVSGSGKISGTYNTHNNVITWTVNWSNLTSPPTSASFYSGAPGTNGKAMGTPWTLTFQSELTNTDSASGVMVLTPDQAEKLINGDWYFTMGTTSNATGEIRGQIKAQVY